MATKVSAPAAVESERERRFRELCTREWARYLRERAEANRESKSDQSRRLRFAGSTAPSYPFECPCGEVFHRSAARTRSGVTWCPSCKSSNESEWNSVARRRLHAGVAWEPISRVRLRRDSGNCCQACGLPFEDGERRSGAPELMAFTVDHIVPVNLGGSHTYSNVQALHMICNQRRARGTLALREEAS